MSALSDVRMPGEPLGSQSFVDTWLPIIEDEIRISLRADLTEGPLRRPLSYVLATGGKRLRPLLALAVCRLIGGVPADALGSGAGIELIHMSSLLLDDLPCMDDDLERRGMPTVHVAFDEATAVLTALLLFNEGHRLLARDLMPIDPLWYDEVCDLVGCAGMIGGQTIDLGLGGSADLWAGAERRFRHLRKTSGLIEASVLTGSLCAGARGETVETVRGFGRRLGEVYQMVDDFIDGEWSAGGTPNIIIDEAKRNVMGELTGLGGEFGTTASFHVAVGLVGSMIERSA